jgi:hypothetical protein
MVLQVSGQPSVFFSPRLAINLHSNSLLNLGIRLPMQQALVEFKFIHK